MSELKASSLLNKWPTTTGAAAAAATAAAFFALCCLLLRASASFYLASIVLCVRAPDFCALSLSVSVCLARSGLSADSKQQPTAKGNKVVVACLLLAAADSFELAHYKQRTRSRFRLHTLAFALALALLAGWACSLLPVAPSSGRRLRRWEWLLLLVSLVRAHNKNHPSRRRWPNKSINFCCFSNKKRHQQQQTSGAARIFRLAWASTKSSEYVWDASAR